jgi:Tfp pilus assembly protein PilN
MDWLAGCCIEAEKDFGFQEQAGMEVRLNLATKALESHRRFLAGASFSAFAAAVVFIALGWHVYSVRRAATEVRTRRETLNEEFARYDAQRRDLERYFKQKSIADIHDRAAFINGIIAVRSFNWTQMFMDLERILPGGVRIINIEPKQVSGHVELNLTFGAANDEVKLKFVRALETSRQFSEVEIHSDVQPTLGSGPNSDPRNNDQRVVQLSTYYSGT